MICKINNKKANAKAKAFLFCANNKVVETQPQTFSVMAGEVLFGTKNMNGNCTYGDVDMS